MNKHINDIKTLFTRSDVILIVSIIFISLIMFSVLFLNKEDHKYVQVFVENRLFGTYTLDKDQVIDINHHNQIEIKNGRVRMKYSSCKNQTCVHQGWSVSNPIVCIPNKTSIQFYDSKKIKRETKILITH